MVKGEPLGFFDLLIKLMSGVPHYHMWFIYMIVFLYLFTPFFRKMVVSCTEHELLILIGAAFFIAAVNTLGARLGILKGELFINWFLSYIPYYLLGYFISTKTLVFKRCALLMIFSSTVFLTAVGCYLLSKYGKPDLGMYFYDYLSITVAPMALSVMCAMTLWTKPIYSEKVVQKLASLSLGVYLMHPSLVEIIQYTFSEHLSAQPLLSIPLVSFTVLSLSAYITYLFVKTPFLNKIV